MSDFESKYIQYQPELDLANCWVREVRLDATTPDDTVIRADQEWEVHLEWTVSGLAVPVTIGTWHVDVYLESIGPGPEIRLPLAADHIINVVPGQATYTFNHRIDPFIVPVPAQHSRPYLLAATIVFHRPDNRPGPMAGFFERAMLQFYNAEE
jgi:hypothetical protein